ncbi:phenylalanine--tRNA ligase subunit beta [Sulfurovum sp.]|uniref:phenylalanine--tRNA ligase subunit beta n=1 Tax=Sulfurovum sp. TaxID=1969726 RepID=UPI0025D6A348|nr:phenylalanine--tRNA ligase subunit beta [Sulfurovum sp.]
MIVTRSWLNEFIDLSQVSNDRLYETFNAIGLEVDSIDQIEIDPNVLIGKIISCEKHPDADKLNVCQIDVGDRIEQIVCGAANVVNAEYVAVATIGAVLPGNFEIKNAELRGVKSAGMVCASSELGLPETGKGIMILDESIGELEVGKPLGEYAVVADTVIELELTANRGDCLSIYGVARDLSAALNIEMKAFEYKQAEKMKLGIARDAELHTEGEMDADLRFKLATMDTIGSTFLMQLRLAMVKVEAEGNLAKMLAYAIHTTGVILRAYDCTSLCKENEKIIVIPKAKAKGIIEVTVNDKILSVVGVDQAEAYAAVDTTKKLLIEASYIDPDLLVEAVATNGLKTDDLYYKTSRGANPDLVFGLQFLASLLDIYSDINCYEGSLDVQVDRQKKKIIVSASEVSSIIGMNVELNRIVTILQKLGFGITSMDHEHVAVTVPLFRHDMKNIQDITEEVVRIVGINNIEAKPFVFAEKRRLNHTFERYKIKKSFKNRAVGNGFYENVSYVFTERAVLEKYGFSTVEKALDLANPIAEELDTLRSTILINLLNAVKRNVSYSKKSIPLFEIGAVFGPNREQSEVLSFVFSGQIEGEHVANAGKPKLVDFTAFTKKIGGVIGTFELLPCSQDNALIHPYQSADILVNGKVCGYMSKLHPTVQEAYGIPVTFMAELSMDVLLPEHINATDISKFQGVYKDLSIVIDKSLSYFEVAKILNGLDLPLLKEYYPVDIYEDEKLGDKKSLTVRFLIQSMEKTLEDSDIESLMQKIMSAVEAQCNAELR